MKQWKPVRNTRIYERFLPDGKYRNRNLSVNNMYLPQATTEGSAVLAPTPTWPDANVVALPGGLARTPAHRAWTSS